MRDKTRQYKVIPRASIESLLAKPAPYGRDLKVTRADENPRPIKSWFTSVLKPLQMLIAVLFWLILLPIKAGLSEISAIRSRRQARNWRRKSANR